jgi:hypothetical protein
VHSRSTAACWAPGGILLPPEPERGTLPGWTCTPASWASHPAMSQLGRRTLERIQAGVRRVGV